jgi:hypothetical protein
VADAPTAITDPYLPAGATSFHVADPGDLAVGDAVFVERPVTDAWIHAMDMDTLVRNGAAQTWLSAGTTIRTDRTIAAIDGDRVTLDVPISDSIDAALLPGARLVRYTWPGRIANVGVEQLRVLAPPQGDSIDDPRFQLFTIAVATDAWVRDVYMKDCVDCSSVAPTAKRVTLQDITIQHTGAVTSSAKPADFALDGTQVLLHRARDLDARNVYTIVTQARSTGPIVVLDYESTEQQAVEPHQRWATGVLLDNLAVDGSISLWNRGNYGSGHGWTVGWGVAWNSAAERLLIQRPPGTQNWAIGSSGTIIDRARPGRSSPVEPRGEIESHATRVTPDSLYRAQLCVRLGPEALMRLDGPAL